MMDYEKTAYKFDLHLADELLKICRSVLNNNQLTIDDALFPMRRNWLLAARVLFEIEKLTGKIFPAFFIFDAGTVREIVKKIEFTDKPFGQTGKDRDIVHLFYGDFNFGGAHIRHFLEFMGDRHRINPVLPHIPRKGEPVMSLEDMAAERLESILETQPDGPYTLVGYCAGALVGFEAGRLLAGMGKEIKAIVMIDPVIISVRRSAQAIFQIKDFFMRLKGVAPHDRHERLVMTYKKMYDWNIKTKDIWRLTHLVSTWKQMNLTSCRLIDIPHPVHYILHRSWRERVKLIGRLHRTGAHIQSERMVDEEFVTDRFNYYFATHLDYNPRRLDVPVFYISLEFSGRAWRRISPNTTFMNVCRGIHNFWKGDFMPRMFDEINQFIDR